MSGLSASAPGRAHRAAVLAALALVLLATRVFRPDDAALAQVDSGWKRALATFAVARTLNALLSVAQGTELTVQPAGVGVTLAPGQVLDPINDLIEQFSTLMLLASAAYAAQRVLIGMGAWWPLGLLLSAVALAWAWGQWHGRPRPWLARLLLGLLVVRFMVPAVVLGSEALFQRFLQPDYAAAQQSLERSSVEIAAPAAAASAAPAAAPGVAERLRRWWGETADPAQRLEELKTRANEAVEHVVRLIVVFTLQTLVLPLLLGWVLWRLLRAAVFGADTYRH